MITQTTITTASKRAKRWLVNTLLLSTCFLLFIAIGIIGSFYLTDSKMEADYYFETAYKLDGNDPASNRKALTYYKKAAAIYEHTGHEKSAVDTYIHLGLLHMKFGNVLQVERMVLKALELGEEKVPQNLKTKIYLLLASTSEPKKAYAYINQALSLATTLNMPAQIAQAYFIKGKMHEYQAQFEQAEASYLKAIKVIDGLPSSEEFSDLVTLYERLGEIYAGNGNLQKAITYYDHALFYSYRQERGSAAANYMQVIGDLYHEQHNEKKACEFWKKSKEEFMYHGQRNNIKLQQPNYETACDAT